MTIPTHIAAGLVIGSLSGNYYAAMVGSLIPDLDHLYSYHKHKILFSPGKLREATLNPQDPWGDQRNYFHSLPLIGVIWFVSLYFETSWTNSLVLGLLGHQLLDALDGSDYYPFYPSRKPNIRGFVDYASINEFLFFLTLLVALLISS